MNLNTLYHGDCRQIMAAWPAGFADACITDPPYGDTTLCWDHRCDGWIEAAARVLKPAASIWVFGSMRFLAPLFAEMEAAGFRYAQDIVWEKQNGTGFQADRFRRVHEHAVQFYRGPWGAQHKVPQTTPDAIAKTVRNRKGPTHCGKIGEWSYTSVDGGPRLMRSVIRARNEHGRAVHPTQKPLEIVSPLVAYSVPKGGIVIDPFFGSGTTAIAAENNGCSWIGCELNPEYLSLYERRTEQRRLSLGGAA